MGRQWCRFEQEACGLGSPQETAQEDHEVRAVELRALFRGSLTAEAVAGASFPCAGVVNQVEGGGDSGVRVRGGGDALKLEAGWMEVEVVASGGAGWADRGGANVDSGFALRGPGGGASGGGLRPTTDGPEAAGDRASVLGFAETWQRVHQRPLTLQRLGSLEDLERETHRRVSAEPQNLYAWLPLMYARGMFGGQALLGPLHVDRYPHVVPETLAVAFARGAA